MTKKQECFCSFCKNQRTINLKRHISIIDLAFTLLAAVLLSFVFWQKLDPRLMVSFVLLVAFAEVITRVIWRLNMICPYCAFDPILYSKDPEKACEKVKKYMDLRKNQPNYILSSRQFDKLPKLIKKKDSESSDDKEQTNTETESS